MTSMRTVTGFFAVLFLLLSQAVSAQLPDFTELAAQNAPSVVNISTKQKNSLGKQFKNIPEMPKDSPLGDLFEHFFGAPFNFEQMPDELFNTESLGSGFVISEDGYILTNHHVVNEAEEIIVRFSDRREYVATLIGSDKATDVALIKIEATGLPVVRMGKGNELKVGEWVLAIGSPFGFDHSVTAGIVSAKGRSLPTENYVPFIQTDVAINPGNSGGPLFNLDGEVVGINSQIYSRTGGFMGLSFAIPIEVAMNVADQLRNTGRVSRGWLGVLIQDVTRELAESFGMEQPSGALVARVMPDSPAEKAGVKLSGLQAHGPLGRPEVHGEYLKMAIRHRKNSLFYKTQRGADVGDAYMTLLHTCYFSGADPFDYLTELQRHEPQVQAAPDQWLPWNYREQLARE